MRNQRKCFVLLQAFLTKLVTNDFLGMNKHSILTQLVVLQAFTLVALGITGCTGCEGCRPVLEVDPQLLQEKIYDPTATEYEGLEQNVTLYIDHSTCVIDAVKNTNSVLTRLIPNLSVYTDELVLIKGSQLDEIQLEATDKTNKITEIWSILNNIRSDAPYAEIKDAVKKICSSNQQAILITDCEYFVNRQPSDAPYMSAGFKEWLQQGHSIHIVVEPYQEKYQGSMHDKKRFYFFFTNDRLQAPISNLIESELSDDGSYTKFKLTNSDIFVRREGEVVAKEDLTPTYESLNGFDYIAIEDDWNTIRKYVMKLDKYGAPMPEEEPVPLIKNYVFNDGNNYFIGDVEIIATNITSQYLASEDETITPNNINMSDGFMIDKNALKNNTLNVFLTDKIFNYLTDEYGGNLIRLDFVVTQAGLQNYDADMFSWQSLYDGTRAVCVSKSIDNVLRDVDIVPMSKDRRVIHTVFIKTEAYK